MAPAPARRPSAQAAVRLDAQNCGRATSFRRAGPPRSQPAGTPPRHRPTTPGAFSRTTGTFVPAVFAR
eukprot:9478501-Heterocapsa_arctica.AAC.1